jgi:hypothetical protein
MATIARGARINVCVHDERRAAREAMKAGIARSLIAQVPDFFTVPHAGLTVPSALHEHMSVLPYTHDPKLHRMLAAEPDPFVVE